MSRAACWSPASATSSCRDDAFGVEVANRLADRALPAGVRVEDFGIRGVHLAYELLEGYDALVLIDAVPMGEPPGTLAVIEPELRRRRRQRRATARLPAVDAHTMSPDVVLATLARLGGSVEQIVIVGCQPADLDEGMGLSAGGRGGRRRRGRPVPSKLVAE